MGLDATVYCDCAEAGRLHVPLPSGWALSIEPDGSRIARAHGLAEDEAVWEWERSACDHEDGVLIHHYIGNIARVGSIRNTLSHQCEPFPFLLERVICNGVHCGDFLSPHDVVAIQSEVAALVTIHGDGDVAEECLRTFERQFIELIEVALRLSKPIAF